MITERAAILFEKLALAGAAQPDRLDDGGIWQGFDLVEGGAIAVGVWPFGMDGEPADTVAEVGAVGEFGSAGPVLDEVGDGGLDARLALG